MAEVPGERENGDSLRACRNEIRREGDRLTRPAGIVASRIPVINVRFRNQHLGIRQSARIAMSPKTACSRRRSR